MLPDLVLHEVIAALELLARLGQAVTEAQQTHVAGSGSLCGAALSASEADNQGVIGGRLGSSKAGLFRRVRLIAFGKPGSKSR